MNDLLEKSSASLRPSSANMNNSTLNSSFKKLKFGETTNNKGHTANKQSLNSSGLMNSSLNKSSTAKTKTSATHHNHNNSVMMNNSTSNIHHNNTRPIPVKKPTIEYNAYCDNRVDNEKTTLYSTWTPLADEDTNNKVDFKKFQIFYNNYYCK